MIFFPAIDLKDGQCVRLLRGDMERATVFATDPPAQARAFADSGAEWLHVVDLNGAVEGRAVNGATVEAILEAVRIPVQLGGGIRDRKALDGWLAKGVRRVILGTAALKDPALVRGACRDHPGRVCVAVDARDGKVATHGWAKTSERTAIGVAKDFEDAGVAALLYTDIIRDGAMEGPNVAATIALAEAVSIPVIASGGVSALADILTLAEAGAGLLAGVVAGRALYDGHLQVAAAVAALKEPPRPVRH